MTLINTAIEGRKIEVDEATGAAKVTMEDGRVMEMFKDGSCKTSLPFIKNIGIENLLEVKTYTIDRVGNRVSHHVEFYNGGWFKANMTMEGNEVSDITFQGNKIDYTSTPAGEIIFKVHTGAK